MSYTTEEIEQIKNRILENLEQVMLRNYGLRLSTLGWSKKLGLMGKLVKQKSI